MRSWLYFQTFLLLTILTACKCRPAEDKFVDNYTSSLFPYSQNQVIRMHSSSGETKKLEVVLYEHIVESVSYTEGDFDRKYCYDTDRFAIQIRDSSDQKNLGFTLYPPSHLNTTSRSSLSIDAKGFWDPNYYADEYTVLDSFTIGSTVYNNVLLIDTTTGPDGYNQYAQFIRFYLAPYTGIIQIEGNNGQIWMIDN